MGALYDTAEDGSTIYATEIHRALDEYICAAREEWEGFDMRKAPQTRWNAALMYIYRACFKGTYKLKSRTYRINGVGALSNCNKYDTKKLLSVCDVYINLCYEFDKEVSILGFQKLTGISYKIINGWKNDKKYYNPNSDSIDSIDEYGKHIYLLLTTEREESLSNRLVSSSNPLGSLSILNHKYNWNSPSTQVIRHEIDIQDASQIAKKYGIELPQKETE